MFLIPEERLNSPFFSCRHPTEIISSAHKQTVDRHHRLERRKGFSVIEKSCNIGSSLKIRPVLISNFLDAGTRSKFRSNYLVHCELMFHLATAREPRELVHPLESRTTASHLIAKDSHHQREPQQQVHASFWL